MSRYDAIIVGGGPAGSTCAWQLVRMGFTPLILDRARFPRVKPCAGWITPPVLSILEIDPEEYRQKHTLQDFYGFNICRMNGRETRASYGAPISYGIVRSEFDHYLLRRSGAEVIEATAVESIHRDPDGVIINDTWSAPLLIGAGGHTCPVARHLGIELRKEKVISTLELETELSASQMEAYGVEATYPEIAFFDDFRGYGWCFRKGAFMNIGVGRTQPHRLRKHLLAFLERLQEKGKIPASRDFSDSDFRGYAYKLHKMTPRPYFDERVLLIGDSAGLSFNVSGEGIRPAVESALSASRVIGDCKGDYSCKALEAYRDLLWTAYGKPLTGWKFRAVEALPPHWFQIAGRILLSIPSLARRVVIDGFFLHHETADAREKA